MWLLNVAFKVNAAAPSFILVRSRVDAQCSAARRVRCIRLLVQIIICEGSTLSMPVVSRLLVVFVHAKIVVSSRPSVNVLSTIHHGQ